MTSETHGRFKRWFWRPPRAHGETIADRQVSSLELFYDLVYVAVIGQAAHHLAEHVTVRGLAEFAVVFALIWIAWINGSLYLELHGREDGRTRSIVFVQMGVLVLLAVFTADAADGSGWGFAVVYATYQVVQTGLWYTVWRQDRRDHPEFGAATGAIWSAWACRRRSSGPAPCWRPPHGSSCGPALGSPGSLASCWPPGAPASAWA
jgi:low temperature requirement protein LtrA